MQLNKILALNVGIDALSKTSGFSIETAFKIAKLNVSIKNEMKPFEEARIQLLGKYINPQTGQPKDAEAQTSIQAEFQKLLEQETPFVAPVSLTWLEITSNTATVAPSKLDTLYREHILEASPPNTDSLKVISNLSLSKLIELSTALFELGAQDIPLNSKLLPLILNNLNLILPLAEDAFKGNLNVETVSILPIPRKLAMETIKNLTPEALVKLWDFFSEDEVCITK